MRSAETRSWRSSRRLSRIENSAFIARNIDASSRSPCVSEIYEFMARFPRAGRSAHRSFATTDLPRARPAGDRALPLAGPCLPRSTLGLGPRRDWWHSRRVMRWARQGEGPAACGKAHVRGLVAGVLRSTGDRLPNRASRRSPISRSALSHRTLQEVVANAISPPSGFGGNKRYAPSPLAGRHVVARVPSERE